MKISKRSFITKVTEFMKEVAKRDVKVFTQGDNTIVFRNLENLCCDLDGVISEYDKIVEAYDRFLKGVYENIEDVIDSDKNIDEKMLGLVYMLAASRYYSHDIDTGKDEDYEIDKIPEIAEIVDDTVIHFTDATYTKYVIELYYLEWANINIELPAEKYNEVLIRIKNRFLGVDE